MTKSKLGSSEASQSTTPLNITEDESELVCGACLLTLFSDDCEFIASPAGCPHLYHWDCLCSWAELQNTCPQCKNRFRAAAKYACSDREFVECAKFKTRNRVGRDDTTTDSTNGTDDTPPMIDLCEKCKCPGNDEDMILCDGMDFTCNALFHYKCVGFASVPAGLWFCAGCIAKGYIPEELKSDVGCVSPVKKVRLEKAESVGESIVIKKARDTGIPAISVRKYPLPEQQQSPIPIRPTLFPRQLVVHPEATTRAVKSSPIPRNLLQPVGIPFLAIPSVYASQESIFARFRKRRLELKRVAAASDS